LPVMSQAAIRPALSLVRMSPVTSKRCTTLSVLTSWAVRSASAKTPFFLRRAGMAAD
jgi:hypothetical protein